MPYEKLAHWASTSWDTRNGRVTLAGDAAHSMLPFRGQGLNHSIQDVHNLVQAVTETYQDAAAERKAELIQEYSDEAARRGGEEAELSKKNGYMLMDYARFMDSPYMKHGLSRQS